MSAPDDGPWFWNTASISGPMLVTRHGGQKVILCGDTRRAGGLLVRDQVECRLIRFDPMHPNAMLIETAPELLAACKAARSDVEVLRNMLAEAHSQAGLVRATTLLSELNRVIAQAQPIEI